MKCALLLAVMTVVPAQAQYNVATYAGGGPNNVNATIVPVGDVTGIVTDPSGHVYFASSTLHRVFKIVNGTGNLIVLAGYGQAGGSGDGAAARDAALSAPRGLAMDGTGTLLYIADTGNHRIRKVDLGSGIITTFAGTGTIGSGGDGFAATSAQLSGPKGVSTDLSGNVYIADTGNHKIRKVTSGGTISTFAGTGAAGYSGDGLAANSAQLNTPSGMALDSINNVLYIADELNHRIRRVTLGAQNTISTVVNQAPGTAGFSGDGNSALTAQVNRPQAVAVDTFGNLYIADTYNLRIRRVAVSGGNIGNITTIVGNGLLPGALGDGGSGANARLNFPATLTLDTGARLYIGDTLDGRVRSVPPPYNTATILTNAGNGGSITNLTYFGDNAAASDAILTNPMAEYVNSTGTILLIADTFNHLVRKVNMASGIITTVAGTGVQGFAGDGGAATSASLNYPTGVAMDTSGNIFIADWGNNKIRRISAATGNITTFAGSPTNVAGFAGNGGNAANALLNGPYTIALDGADNLFIADANNYCIRRVAGDTQIITTVVGTCTQLGFGGDGQAPTGPNARLNWPVGVAVNSTGTVIYIADANNNRIRWVNNAILGTFAGTGAGSYTGDGGPAIQATLNGPTGVTLDSQGNLFIADRFNQRIRRVPGGNSNNIITTIAGNGVRGFAGDNGAASGAQFADPWVVGADPVTGRLYVGDFANNRVRVLFAPCSYQLNPPSNAVPSSGGVFQIQVTAAAGCTWNSSVPGGIGWLNFTGGQTGSGNGTVSYSVAANSGAGRSTQLTIAGISFQVTQQGALVADFNADGRQDVIWQDQASGWAQVWFLGGATGTAFAGAANLTLSNTWRIVGLGDFNGDGRSDVVWQDPATGAAQVWYLGGAQGNAVTNAATISGGNSWRIMSVADFNGDGHPDLIWQDPVTGLAQIWFLNGANGTSFLGAANLTQSNTWRIVGTGDFNGDGRPDVVWQDPATGAAQVWYLGGAQGNAVTGAATITSGNPWRIAAIADFNGDGSPDLVWQDPSNGTSGVWFMSGATYAGAAGLSLPNPWRIAGPR